MERTICRFFLFALLIAGFRPRTASAAYRPVKPRAPKAGEIAVKAPGACAKAGAVYVLTADITSARTALFLGKDVVLDLNGHTLTYAAGYRHLPNYDFARGLREWDVSRAPGAKVANTRMRHPLVGDNSLLLPAGQEIVSPYLELPVAKRAYYAMVAVANQNMHVGVYVEDAQGKTVECAFRFGGNLRPCCPEKRRASKLGGGVVFALMFGKPAGKYRVRVKAVNRDAVIGAVDLLPALDVGVGIVEKTMPWAYYKCILDGDSTAFFDYTEPGTTGKPVAGVPVVRGAGRILIRNGVIKSGPACIRTWGVLSTAGRVRVDIENVKFVATGINACAVRAPFGSLKDCRFELDNPFIIDRHGVRGDPVNYYAKDEPAEISGCEFVGGQGCLVVHGRGSKVHHNVFHPRQTVTNHYAVHVAADACEVFANDFSPIVGSGINIFYQQHVRIYDNRFTITSAPPNNEYGNTDYSTNAIRLTDYGARKGNPKGWCENNEIFRNTIRVTARDYPGCHKNYKSMAYAVFMSVGGGQNYIHDNDIVITHRNPGSRNSGAFAFYIGGSRHGGVYYRNRVRANVTPVWIANRYGPGENVTFYENTFIKAEGAGDFPWFRLGWYKHFTRNVAFYSNRFPGSKFSVVIDDYTSGYRSEYLRGHTLTVLAAAGTEVVVRDRAGNEVRRGKTDAAGRLLLRLARVRVQGDGRKRVGNKLVVQVKKTDVSRYVVAAGGKEKNVTLDRDQTLDLR